ncbi:PhzF family phenazine biosynthesis protein [Thermomonas sp.]|uniref:PhzF family phenazine biosynthesis protein n=1 Tax=Thermomonas sp. TaxID=1971895 RepID=UPI001ACAE392|nr:PhzF family phenazine biosynthesis protein [Xanthomonadales bacterium]MBN8794616.1 PhzF family phenazine biosynthesis protein [Stenotrophomonas nitritireducens]
MPRRYVQLDVFASRPGAGNPLAVVLDAQGLDDAAMQAIARWTRLPETTFVFPPTAPEATHAIRIFSPRREVPFAGHPSVGTAYALLDAGLVKPRIDAQGAPCLVQEGIAGLLPLRVRGEGATRTLAVRTPRARVQEIAAPDDARLAAALAGLRLGALPPVLMDGGRRWWLVELADEAHLRAATPDWEAIAALAEATDSMGLFVYARSHDPVYYYAVRAFVGAPARFEDAASGAANATLAAWLAARGALPPSPGGFYRVSQGREVGFDAILELTVDAQGEVWSGGRAVPVVRGTLDWPQG